MTFAEYILFKVKLESPPRTGEEIYNQIGGGEPFDKAALQAYLDSGAEFETNTEDVLDYSEMVANAYTEYYKDKFLRADVNPEDGLVDKDEFLSIFALDEQTGNSIEAWEQWYITVTLDFSPTMSTPITWEMMRTWRENDQIE